MKTYSNFFYTLAVQLGVIWFSKGISNSLNDQIALSIVLIVFCTIFVIGAKKISQSLDISQSQFNARFFGSMGLRIVVALISIAIYLFTSKIPNKFGAIFLLISYFVYMGFEIKIILHKLRTDSEKSQNTDDARK
ncbi:MAG: hypothetical protein IT245_04600 [Bacteroidia bacterium]|nr:hypothetical protein [Bacteroidia bacterium]